MWERGVRRKGKKLTKHPEKDVSGFISLEGFANKNGARRVKLQTEKRGVSLWRV